MSNHLWGVPLWVWGLVAAVGLVVAAVGIVRARRRARVRRSTSGAKSSSSIGKAVTPPQFRVFRDDGAASGRSDRDGDSRPSSDTVG